MLEQRNLPRRFVMGETFARADHFALHLLLHGGNSNQLRPIGPDDSFFLRPLLELLEVGDYQHRWETTLVADHDSLTYELVGLDQILDRLWRDILAAGCDNDVLLAIRDCNEAVADLADVTRM